METLVPILLMVLVISLPFLMLFLLLIYPIWMLVRAAKNTRLKGKPAWIIGMVLLWPLPQLVYGSLIDPNRIWRFISRFSFVIILCGMMGLYFAFGYFAEESVKETQHVAQLIETNQVTIAANHADTVQSELKVIASKIQSLSWVEYETLEGYVNLIEALQLSYEGDNHISDQEYKEWKAVLIETGIVAQ